MQVFSEDYFLYLYIVDTLQRERLYPIFKHPKRKQIDGEYFLYKI